MDDKIYSAIDANINRALEGLRVCEDIFRFVNRDAKISVKLKNLRHEIIDAVKIFPQGMLLRERDVAGDEIKFLDADSEKKRDSVFDLARKNLRRSAEALRSIEEFFKIVKPGENRNPFQEIRFTIYTLEKDICLPLLRAEKMNKFENALYAILDSAFVKNNHYAKTAERMIKGGVSILQLRMKDASTKDILSAARDVTKICRDNGVIFIVNDYPEVAVLSGADGVHLGQDDLPAGEARKILPPEMLIGVSAHSETQAFKAADENPDYLAIGPIFDTKSKYGDLMKGIGVDIIKDIINKTDIPLVAIGGIDNSKIAELKETGCRCFAVLSYLYKDDKIEDNCRELTAIL
jgi:thiamine-phosphate pyrophosphorylase